MVTTENTTDNPNIEASPIPRMQDLEAQAEMPQVTIVVKNHNLIGTSKDHGVVNKEMEEFEAFKRYKSMKRIGIMYIYTRVNPVTRMTNTTERKREIKGGGGDERRKITSQRVKQTKEYH
ncbi:unnamed protein product [Lactuca virosa]|uniref:Uncharacterized protein n=1 Tax=Lactuca virosa TaxID=75947 RepID=A0AAU9LRR8_9ASTR|nr:unnamed protein product [Lactuca virosa]